MWTGAVLIGCGLYFLIAGWLFPHLGGPQLKGRSYWPAVDTHTALLGAGLLILVGLFLVAYAVVGKLRGCDRD